MAHLRVTSLSFFLVFHAVSFFPFLFLVRKMFLLFRFFVYFFQICFIAGTCLRIYLSMFPP